MCVVVAGLASAFGEGGMTAFEGGQVRDVGQGSCCTFVQRLDPIRDTFILRLPRGSSGRLAGKRQTRGRGNALHALVWRDGQRGAPGVPTRLETPIRQCFQHPPSDSTSLLFISREHFSPFFPPRLASNCATIVAYSR